MRPTLEHLAKDLSELRVRNYVLQEFRADGCVDTTLVKISRCLSCGDRA